MWWGGDHCEGVNEMLGHKFDKVVVSSATFIVLTWHVKNKAGVSLWICRIDLKESNKQPVLLKTFYPARQPVFTTLKFWGQVRRIW